MADVHLAPGMLVTLPDRRGVATFVSAYGDQATVSRSHSVQAFQPNKLGRVATDPTSRGYVISKNGWRIGRVKHPFVRYNVCFPNGDAAALAEGSSCRVGARNPCGSLRGLGTGRRRNPKPPRSALGGAGGRRGFPAALEGLTSAQAQLNNNLRERLGGGACL